MYLVSVTGVTGSRPDMDYMDGGSLPALVDRIREKTGLPVGVGFGISTPRQAKKVASFSDAVIVGSSIMKMVENGAGPDEIGGFIASLSAVCQRDRQS